MRVHVFTTCEGASWKDATELTPKLPALAVLTCSACTAPVAPAREPRACAHCGALVVTPPEYIEALDVAEREIVADSLTRDAFNTLGRPPTFALQFLAAVFLSPYGIVALLFFAFVGAFRLVDFVMESAPRWFGINAYDWLSTKQQFLITWGLGFWVVLVVVVLGVLGRRRAIGRDALRAALASKPPSREGGPALCRECGAPLVVSPEALGVRCLHCGADNLVRIPPSILARAKHSTAGVTREAKAVLAAQRSEIRALVRRLAIGLVSIGAFAALLGRCIAQQEDDPTFDLPKALSGERALFDFYAKPVGYAASAVTPRVPIDGCAARYEIARKSIDCLGGDCWLAWFVAIRAGETLTIDIDQRGEAELFEHVHGVAWHGDLPEHGWGHLASRVAFDASHPVLVRAEHTAWYRLRLAVHDVSDDDVTLCAKLGR